MARKIGVARFWYEGNSFSPLNTDLSHFMAEEWHSGVDLRRNAEGIESEMGGAVAFAINHPDVDLVFLHCCSAPPGGKMTDEAFATIRELILDDVKSQNWDGFYLSLHGAAVTESNPLPDLELLREIKKLLGKVPLGVTFDLHANLSQDLLDCCDLATGYKTYPHTDMKETAYRLLTLLCRHLDGEKTCRAFAKIPIIVPSFNMRTDDGPMTDLIATGKSLDCIDITLFGGFAYADSPAYGPAILVLADNQEKAAQAAERLKEKWGKLLPDFFISLPKPEDALAALPNGHGPVVLLDPADNPLSGGIGDTTSLFRALLAHSPAQPALFAFFFDPDLVSRCHKAGVGVEIDGKFGGRIAPEFGAPVLVKAKILKNTDGRFRNQGPMWHGGETKLGKTTLLEVGNIQVIITETCQTPNDPGYFELHGIEVASLKLLCVKAKNHFRAAFKDKVAAIIDVNCPGPAALDLTHFKYRYAIADRSALSAKEG